MNGSDCGVFSCKYAEYLSRDAPFTFSQVSSNHICCVLRCDQACLLLLRNEFYVRPKQRSSGNPQEWNWFGSAICWYSIWKRYMVTSKIVFVVLGLWIFEMSRILWKHSHYLQKNWSIVLPGPHMGLFWLQEDMPYFRHRMIYEILTKKLMWCSISDQNHPLWLVSSLDLYIHALSFDKLSTLWPIITNGLITLDYLNYFDKII